MCEKMCRCKSREGMPGVYTVKEQANVGFTLGLCVSKKLDEFLMNTYLKLNSYFYHFKKRYIKCSILLIFPPLIKSIISHV